jgi:ribose 5-phosphate isomerase B
MIALASDHGGFDLKEEVKKHLQERNIEFKDFGTFDKNSCDYPDFGVQAARAVASGECEKGIVVCTTGIGISIVANKIKGVRCALCSETTSVRLTREHNDANVLAMGGGMTGELLANEIVDVFLDTPFSNLEKHSRRIAKISEIEA